MAQSVSAALAEAEKLVAALKAFDGTPAGHLGLLKQTETVRRSLEEPYDIVTRLLENMACSAALYTTIGIGALQKLPADGSAIKAADLAAAVNVDISAVQRAFRLIIVNGIATETAPDEYAHNLLSRVFQPEALGGFLTVCVDFMRSWVRYPDYFTTHEPKDLFDLKKSPFSFAEGKEGMTYYEVLNMDSVKRDIWNATMIQIEKNMPVLGMFPFASLKETVEKEPERPFIVDIGGGKGQAMLRIESQGDCPKFFGGQVVLQDLPIVIDTLKPEDIPGITPMAYDIFSGPNPVKNARIYFLRRLLHDSYIPECIAILKNAAAAMGPDSRLIICDMLVPAQVEVGEATELYWLDFSLMAMSGKEKTEKEFVEMFDEVGLELLKIYPSGIGKTVMLETKLKGV